MEPYFGPVRDQLEALEDSIEFSHEHGNVFYEHPYQYEDSLSRTLNALEASIEGTVVPPPAPADESGQPIGGYTSDGPPIVPDGKMVSWIALEPPPAARPYFTRDGLAPLSHRPRPGGSTGIRNEGASGTARWFPESSEWVDEENTCQSCEYWEEDDGEFQCQYWLEESRDETDDQDRGHEE